MPAHGYPAEGQLVAVAGEEIVCPRCGHIEAAFFGDAFGPGGDDWPAAWTPPWTKGLRATVCSACGAAWMLGLGGRAAHEAAGAGTRFIALHVRSGTWTGWRSIGAE